MQKQKTVRHITRSLHVPLLPTEKDEEVENMLDLLSSKQKAQDTIAGLQESIKLQKANIEVLEDQLRDSRNKIKYGVLQDVPCKMILDWDDKHITTFRKDTFEVVEDRDMTAYDKPELQDEPYEPAESEVTK